MIIKSFKIFESKKVELYTDIGSELYYDIFDTLHNIDDNNKKNIIDLIKSNLGYGIEVEYKDEAFILNNLIGNYGNRYDNVIVVNKDQDEYYYIATNLVRTTHSPHYYKCDEIIGVEKCIRLIIDNVNKIETIAHRDIQNRYISDGLNESNREQVLFDRITNSDFHHDKEIKNCINSEDVNYIKNIFSRYGISIYATPEEYFGNTIYQFSDSDIQKKFGIKTVVCFKKDPDEYYYILLNRKNGGMMFYKCDGRDGLKQCIEYALIDRSINLI